MPKRTKEEIAAEKEKEKLRALRRGPDLDRFLEGRKRTFVSCTTVHLFFPVRPERRRR